MADAAFHGRAARRPAAPPVARLRLALTGACSRCSRVLLFAPLAAVFAEALREGVGAASPRSASPTPGPRSGSR